MNPAETLKQTPQHLTTRQILEQFEAGDPQVAAQNLTFADIQALSTDHHYFASPLHPKLIEQFGWDTLAWQELTMPTGAVARPCVWLGYNPAEKNKNPQRALSTIAIDQQCTNGAMATTRIGTAGITYDSLSRLRIVAAEYNGKNLRCIGAQVSLVDANEINEDEPAIVLNNGYRMLPTQSGKRFYYTAGFITKAMAEKVYFPHTDGYALSLADYTGRGETLLFEDEAYGHRLSKFKGFSLKEYNSYYVVHHRDEEYKWHLQIQRSLVY